ncbi:MAG: hypothetical protein HY717_21035 [Planctomycetes bacterium]|nr:hypothetical protein [Planctomycetota bacterium]
MKWRAFFPLLAGALAAPGLFAQSLCNLPQEDVTGVPNSTWYVHTDKYWLEMESASGAAGDVAGVSLILHSQLENFGWLGAQVTVCHDPAVAEIVGEPIYSADFLSLLGAGGVQFHPVDEGTAPSEADKRGHGFILNIHFSPEAYNARFPSPETLPVATVFYRLKGKPGEASPLSFCDGSLALWASRCNHNFIHIYNGEHHQGTSFLSTSNRPGLLTIHDGPATHPDRPPAPPEAKVYSQLPSPEEMNFRVRITGGWARPGDREVPVEVHVSANLEYTGIQIPVDYDERYLRLSRAEDHFLAGYARINGKDDLPGSNPEEGNVLVLSANSVGKQRIAAAGEEVHAATLYFDVLDSASAITETFLDVVPIRSLEGIPYKPWVIARHLNGGGLDGSVEMRSEVEPISINRGRLAIRRSGSALRGDADLNGELEIADAVLVLSHLFRGDGALPCPGAADFDLSGELDITDPIALLRSRFLGDPPFGSLDPAQVPCD